MNTNETAAIYLSDGNQLLEEGNLEEAIAAFGSAIDLNPDYSWSHHNLGEALAKLGQFEEASAAFRRAIELNPDFSWSYHHLGDVLERQQQWKGAIAAFRQAIELNPEHFGSYVGLGKSLENLGQLDEAIAAYRRASELAPEAAWIQYKREELLKQRTKLDLERAIASYRRALELNPDDVQAYRKFLQIEPDNWEVWLQLGKALVKQEQWEEATFAYGRALELNPHIVEAYKKMLEIHPNNAELYLQLQQFLAQQGDVEGAIAYWRQAVDLNPEFANKCFLNGLEGISYLRVNPESLVIYSGELIQADMGKHLVSPKGNQGLVSYGPYIKVEDGLYRINIECEFFDVESSKTVQEESVTIGLRLDVITHHAKDGILYEKNVYINQAKANFFIDLVDVEDLEIRFYATGISFAIHYIDMTCFLPRENKVADYYFDLGNALERQGKHDRALAAYTKAVEFNSQAYLEKVIAVWHQVVDTYPSGMRYFQLGLLLVKHERVEEAFYCYEKALEIDPEKLCFYSELVRGLVGHTLGDRLRDFYRNFLASSPYLLTKALLNLGIALAKEERMAEALNIFSQISENLFKEDEIYNDIWRMLNQLSVLEGNNDYPKEFAPEATYKYFSEKSNYNIINLGSLNEGDRTYLEKLGLSIAHLELICQDDLELEEIYINSLAETPSIKLSRKSSKHLRENKTIYDIKKGRYFQHSIVETGYIYSICPITGIVVKSNQSFPLNAPQPGIEGSWHPIHVYRFVGAEVFYLVCGVMPVGDKSFIYLPKLELIVTFVPNSAYASETQIINMLKTSMVSYWQPVKSYISSDAKKEVVVELGWCANLGHFVWNEMSGLQYLYENQTLQKVKKFLIGHYEYINISDTYPEIPAENIIRWSEPKDSWNLFKAIMDNNYITVWPTDWIIKEDMANRIYQGAVKRCSPSVLQVVEKAKHHFPLIWIAIRSHYRVWLSQVEGIANIINRLSSDYPNLAVVFDGWGRHERYDPRAESEVQREQAIVEKILALIPPGITTYSLIGAMSYERAVWAKATDFYIASYGSGLTFPIWIAGKPGVVHGIVWPETLEKGEWSSLIRENAIGAKLLPRQYSENKQRGYADYDINWQKIYLEVIKLAKKTYKSLERLDQAIVPYKPLIDSSDDEALFHYSLAEALAQTGDLELAINHWRQAVDFNPKLENNCFLAHLKGIAIFRIHPEDLITTSGKITHKSGIFQLLSLHDNQGIVAYGPYIDLPDGLYKIKVDFEYPELSLYGEEENPETVGFKLDVLTEHHYIWYERNVSTSCQEPIEFFIELVNAHKTEIRFWGAGVSFAINFIEFTLLYQPDRESAEFYYMNQGKYLESKGKLEQAFFAYCCSSQINSQYWQRAISVYQKIGKISPDNTVYAKFYLAVNNSQSKSTDLLSEEVRKQINWWQIGDIFARNSLWIEAVQSYQKALQEEPDIATAYQKQVESLATQNELSSFQDTHWKANFFTALLNDPNSVDVYLCLGKLLTAKQRWNEAIYAYRKVLEIVDAVPNINDIYFELGYVLAKANQLEAAIKYYQKSLQVTPKAYIWARIGDVLRRQNKFNEAIEYYEKALQNSLKDYEVYLNLADCLIHNNRLDEASTYLQEIINKRDSRTYQDAVVKLADVWEKQGQSEKANTFEQKNQPEATPEGFYNTTEEWAVATKSTEYREIEPSETQYFPNEYGFISSYSFPKSFVAIVSNGRYCQRDPIGNSYYISPDNKLLLDASLSPHYDISRLDSPPIYNVEGTVAVISGFNCMMYYHWLVDLLPKLGLIFKAEMPLKNIDKFLVPKYSSFHKETLDIIGIPPERILEVSQFPHIKADRLIVTPNVCHLRHSSLKFLRDNLMSPVAKLSLGQPERIYISRRLARGRKFINENEVIEFLARLGFITIDGELLSVEEKISLFSGTKVVVGICGAGLANLAFCQPGTKVIEIFTPCMGPPAQQHYYWVSYYLGLQYYYLKASIGLGSAHLRQMIYGGDQLEEAILDINALKDLLRTIEVT